MLTLPAISSLLIVGWRIYRELLTDLPDGLKVIILAIRRVETLILHKIPAFLFVRAKILGFYSEVKP
jgi:hypothetical protein